MQDNEFEQHVRDKLARMQMEASDTVWQRVENGLDGKRKRRRWLIWLPAGAVGLIIFAIVYSTSINQERKSADLIAQKPTNFKAKEQIATGETELITDSSKGTYKANINKREGGLSPDSAGLNPINRNYQPAQAENALSEKNGRSAGNKADAEIENFKSPLENRRVKGMERSTPGISMDKSVRSPTSKSGRSAIAKSARRKEIDNYNGKQVDLPGQNLTIVGKKEPPVSSANRQTAVESKLHNEKTKVVALQERSVLTYPNDQRSAFNDSTVLQIHSASTDSNHSINSASINFLHQPDRTIKTSEAINGTKLPALLTRINPSTSSWRWGLSVSVGRSGITTGKFNALFYSDVASAPNYSAGNLGNVAVARPSQVKPALSLSFGGFVEHQLETSTYFKAGLQFSRFSTGMLVGSFRDQTVLLRSTANMADKSIGSYYTAGQTQHYTNAYAFIDAPLSLGFNFATRTRMPFAWEIGVSPSIMLGSNALHFNQGSSIYYKDNSLFKKSQFALITSLPINVYNGNKYTLLLSPSFRYNTSNLFLPEINEKKHLLSAGIGLSVKFKK